MDMVIAVALNEVCARKCDGIRLNDLWPLLRNPISSLGLHLCNGVKQSVWNGLLNVPAIRFVAHDFALNPCDSSILSVDELEKLGLKMVAADHLIDSSVGLYDLQYSDMEFSADHRWMLEQLATARKNGITQSELAKAFGNNVFFLVKCLESQGLLVRRPTTVRTKKSDADGSNENKATAIVHTNLLYLYRYGKHLNMGPQQRVEITRLNMLGSGNDANQTPLGGDANGCEDIKEVVLVRDFLPSMTAVCDKLETSGKALAVSDIKKDLGYLGIAGRRAWNNICKRLKQARCIEEFEETVNNKVNAFDCIRIVDASYKSKYFLGSCPLCYTNTPSHLKPTGTERKILPIAQYINRKENSLQREAGININDGHKITLINMPEEDCQPCRETHPTGEAIRFEDYTQEKSSLSKSTTTETCITSNGSHTSCPIFPRLNGDGSTNTIVYRGFVRRILGTVMQNPGMLEEDLTRRMNILNPQTCRKLLDLMILDHHLIVRKMHQTISGGPPALLDAGKRRQEFVHRRHLFANPKSTFLL